MGSLDTRAAPHIPKRPEWGAGPTRSRTLLLGFAISLFASLPALAQPDLVATKTDVLQKDVYDDGNFSPGDTIRYVIEIENQGDAKANNVQFSDTPDPRTRLTGYVFTDKGNATILQGDSAGDAAVEIDLNGIQAGNTVMIEFDVKIDDPLTDDELTPDLSNQGELSGNNFTDLVTDDPETGAADDVTLTPLNDICDGVVPTPYCAIDGTSGPCIGTNGAETITGSTGKDVIVGLGGNDVLIGSRGKDLLCGGPGDDLLFGMDDNDRIEGGPGDDRAVGGRGRDTMSGGSGNDFLQGDEGRDRIEGGPGAGDELNGGLGSDNCTDVDGAFRVISCGPSCGLGFELALLLPGLLWLRGRRRS